LPKNISNKSIVTKLDVTASEYLVSKLESPMALECNLELLG